MKDINKLVFDLFSDDETRIKVLNCVNVAYEEGVKEGFSMGVRAVMEIGTIQNQIQQQSKNMSGYI